MAAIEAPYRERSGRFQSAALCSAPHRISRDSRAGSEGARELLATPWHCSTRPAAGDLMSLLSWIVLGLIAGFIASKIINRTGEGVIVDILLGIVGAIVGGWLFRLFGMPGVTGPNLYSSVIAIIGAVLVLLVYHTMFRRFRDGRR
jgi:uncharacterized membrane protein YeaQ/YmgE (transglycosylase-associated protein family)